MRFVLYIKGGHKRCPEDVPEAVRPYVHSCVLTQNSGGREAHTIALFTVTHYYAMPRMTWFLQDDSTKGPHIERLAAMSDAAYAAWMALAERHMFGSPEMCLCDITVEPSWRPTENCTVEEPEPFPEFPCRLVDGGLYHRQFYGQYDNLKEFMQLFLGHNASAANWTSIRWPDRAEFAVPARRVRSRPLLLYQLVLALNTGEHPAHHDDFAPDTALVFRGLQLNYLAQMFERLWFAVFDPFYQPSNEPYLARLRADPAA